ncbi:MAG: hypothetical protein ACKVQT_05560 [Burkholderiales bacterium]
MSKRAVTREELGLTRAEYALLKSLSSPWKIQDFISRIPTNFEPDGDTYLSVQQVLRQRRAHCIEASMVAATALWINGEAPIMMDIRAIRDDDHVITLYRRDGCWGAISKTNNCTLRFRDPVYRTLRELALSYFHEYSNDDREKTMREYSRAFDLSRVDPALWVTNKGDCYDIVEMLDEIRHYKLFSPVQARKLRLLERVEMRARTVKQFANPYARGNG